jgi:hypothetical protein
VLFTFPSRYWFTIGHTGVLRLGRWSSQIPTGLLVPCGTQGTSRANSDFAYGPITLFRSSFQSASAIFVGPFMEALQPLIDESIRFGLVRFRSPLLPESRLISFPLGTEMFHFPRSASLHLFIQCRMGVLVATGCPIQTSSGHRLLGTSPKLIAASHVFHRLCVPRHPPSALSSLTISLSVEARGRCTAPSPSLSLLKDA